MSALRLALLAAFLQAGVSSQSPVASLEGVVVEHLTGRPIAGVVVELTGIAAPLPDSSASDWRVRSFSTVTGQDGRFAINGVPPGAAYQLVATRSPDFVPAVHGQDHPDDLWAPIALIAGQRLTGLRIALRPLSSISGRIVNKEGKSLRDTRVTALELRYRDGHRILETGSSAYTDALGNYRIAGLTPGRYILRVRPVLLVHSAISPYIYFPGTMDPSDAVSVDVAQTTSIEGLHLKVDEIHLRRVRGVVIPADGRSNVRETRVFLVPPYASPDAAVTREFVSSNGEFDFRDVLPGTYTLFAVAPSSLSGRISITVENKDLQDLRLPVRPDVDLEGRVAFENPSLRSPLDFSNIVVTVSAENRATTDVSLYSGLTTEGQAGPAAPRLELTPGQDGTFTLRGLRSWLYFANASITLSRNTPEWMRSVYLKTIHPGTTDLLNGGQPFDPESRGVLDIVLGTDAGSVAGRIFDENRNGMPHALVVLVPDEPYRNRRDLYRTAQTDAGGRFNIQTIAPGGYKVFAWRGADAGSWFFSEFLRPHEDRAVPVMIGPAETRSVEAPLLSAVPVQQ
jgi:hypothetical protein